MKCPILGSGGIGEWNRQPPTTIDCAQEECAWWDKECSECVLVAIHYRLATISGSLMGMEKTLRHDKLM